MAVVDVEFLVTAWRELLHVCRWYARRSAIAAERFRAHFLQALTRIREDPESWPKYGRRLRWVRVRRFPYYVYYEVATPTLVSIVAVAHGKRRLAYFRRRLR